jgi:hypothetical protein
MSDDAQQPLLIGTTCVLLALQPVELVTVTLSVTLLFPAENVIARVPAPVVIVPFDAVQTYVAPGPASGTEARFPMELRQTNAGDVIDAEGRGLTATLAKPVELQPLLVTVTLRATCPLEPAVNLTVRVPAPEEIVPFVIDHA